MPFPRARGLQAGDWTFRSAPILPGGPAHAGRVRIADWTVFISREARVPINRANWHSVASLSGAVRRFDLAPHPGLGLHRVMGKYDPLRSYLHKKTVAEIEMTFRDIERLIRALLPRAAQQPQWWSNDQASDAMPVQSHAWLEVGYEAFLIGPERVVFRRYRP